jgi:thioesterase domain-containing protein
MEYLAAHYIREMRAVQPDCTYYLLGYSFGGLMAFEIAQQLWAAGEAVAFLGMLDTWQPGLSSENRHRSSRKRLIKEVELRIVSANNLLDSHQR